MLSRYISVVLFSLIISNVLALKLAPIGSPEASAGLRGGSKREASLTMDLDLKDSESFFWGAPDGKNLVYANLTVFFPNDYEYVSAMEKFAPMLKSVNCDNDMMLEFKDKSSFEYAKRTWNWVNEDVNHTFIMVTNYEGCADDKERQPFVVSDIRYDDSQFKAYMTAVQKDWEDVVHTYTLSVGHMPLTPTHRLLMPRDLISRGNAPDFTMNLASSYDKNLFSTTVGSWETSVDAVLRTEGKLNVDFDIETSWFKLKSASMKVQPENVAASIQLALTEKGTLSKGYNWQKTIVSIPVEGIEIAKVVKLGAFLDVDVGFTMDEWSGEARANLGAKMSLSNSAIVIVDLVDSKNNKFSGWTPTFDAIPLTLSAKVEGSAELFAEPNIKLEASALGKGFNLGLNLKMPYIKADFAALAQSVGVCNTKQTLGVDIDTKIGVELSFQAAKAGDEANPFWKQDLYTHEWELFSKCMAFGPENAHSGSLVDPNPVKTKTQSMKSKGRSTEPPTTKTAGGPEPTLTTKLRTTASDEASASKSARTKTGTETGTISSISKSQTSSTASTPATGTGTQTGTSITSSSIASGTTKTETPSTSTKASTTSSSSLISLRNTTSTYHSRTVTPHTTNQNSRLTTKTSLTSSTIASTSSTLPGSNGTISHNPPPPPPQSSGNWITRISIVTGTGTPASSKEPQGWNSTATSVPTLTYGAGNDNGISTNIWDQSSKVAETTVGVPTPTSAVPGLTTAAPGPSSGGVPEFPGADITPAIPTEVYTLIPNPSSPPQYSGGHDHPGDHNITTTAPSSTVTLSSTYSWSNTTSAYHTYRRRFSDGQVRHRGVKVW